MSDNIFLLDGTGFLFRAYFALPEMTDQKGHPVQGVYGFIRSVNKLIKDFSPQHLVVVFDGPDNKKSRTAIYADYKANRTKEYPELPFQFQVAQEFCELAGIPVIVSDGVEADDVLGSMTAKSKKLGCDVYICSADKDMCQLVEDHVYVLNPWKDNLILDTAAVEKIYGIPPSSITDFLSLTGDVSDNIPGVPGIGPKTASELLRTFGSLEFLIDNLDQVKGDKKKQLLKDNKHLLIMSKKLATIDQDILGEIVLSKYLCNPFLDHEALAKFYRQYGFISLLKEVLVNNASDSVGTSHVNTTDHYSKIETIESFQNILMMLSQFKEVSCAFSDIDVVNLSVAISVGKETFYFSSEILSLHPDLTEQLFYKLTYSLIVYFYNSKDEWRQAGQEKFPEQFYDIMLAAYLIDASSKQRSLEDLSLHHLGIALHQPKKNEKLDEHHIYLNCCSKAEAIFQLKPVLDKQIRESGFQTLLEELELPLVPILFDMEKVGIFLDLDELAIIGKRITNSLKELELKIYELVGEEFNIKSAKQLSHILFDKLGLPNNKKGSTGAVILEELQSLHEVIPVILSFRSLEKLRSSYIDSLPKQMNPKTGCIHPSFSQAVTVTGRLACQKPNLQNIPHYSKEGKAIRQAFKPRKSENIFISVDYSQIELRMLAHFSEDAVLLSSFLNDQDIHTQTASKTFKVDAEQVTKEMRQKAKAINFGIIYGQQAYGLSQQLGISVSEAAEMIRIYFECFPGVKEFIKECTELARQTSSVTTLWGRKRVIKGFDSPKSFERALAERLAVNTILQGTAADLIKAAMINVKKILKERFPESSLILQVHDELIFETTFQEKDKLILEVTQIMETVKIFKIPLKTNTSVGKNWAEC
ncbi:DNA polymerase I [Candidatus Clavichlamydia salmonicola]|uniref:DNA polymerase I n=1 Tax=Candidatus Clavichlamydia salmonicola TaxID=469812 RepID=UPI0018914E91|nr:DNA polymerase I [Candidatus Clavichlamydia salmonicola]MBF5050984.1 DNA polymerase I [Candidatus Clavichlamydia salmonicola]